MTFEELQQIVESIVIVQAENTKQIEKNVKTTAKNAEDIQNLLQVSSTHQQNFELISAHLEITSAQIQLLTTKLQAQATDTIGLKLEVRRLVEELRNRRDN